MINRYTVLAFLATLGVVSSYIYQFRFILGYELSTDTSTWGQLGDYTGGLLNPILSFISIVLLIRSLDLQNEANRSLRDELKNSSQTQKKKSFESLFFNMIGSQKELFSSFSLNFPTPGKPLKKTGIEAVLEIECRIEDILSSGLENKGELIKTFLDTIDSNDKIFGIVRAFYIAVKMISDNLSDAEGFCFKDRRHHFLTLINFTDFTQLRLVMIATQFMEFHSTEYLRSCEEFTSCLSDVGLKYDLYKL